MNRRARSSTSCATTIQGTTTPSHNPSRRPEAGASRVAGELRTGHAQVVATDSSVNLTEKLAQFDEHWAPRTVATFNGHDVMVVKVQGEFVWHSHDDTDDFFLVLEGRLTIRLRDREVHLGPGELFVVPVGVEHQPYAEEEAKLLLIEPSGTPNTGDEATATARVEI